MNKQPPADPSRQSFYVDDTLYAWLATLSADWQGHGIVARDERPDDQIREDCLALVAAEARFADALDLERWIECYAPQCVYWIPASNPARDPRTEITHEIHDRRRLEDRVARIRTGFAYSMIPAVRTTHSLGTLEIWRAGAEEIRARANFIIHAVHKERRRVLSGWVGYSFAEIEARWRIAVKQINLIDADYAQENNSFFL